jgi:CxxC motif-containing protein (DUF1111 family)
MGRDAFEEVDSVNGSVAGTEAGLGPRFNLDSCAGCHAQPAIGGSSPAVNPQIAMAGKDKGTDKVPSFITINGPIREVRFRYVDPPKNSVRDGEVHAVFTVSGRSGATGCTISQPDFATAQTQNNLAFRIPTPTFGAGLIEAVTDSAILTNKAANSQSKGKFGITGQENREGNTGTITRFGWKAQNKSLLLFSGEAYNVEQGVTNELFGQERDETSSCLFNGTPEDHTNFTSGPPQDVSSDIIAFSNFMRFLAPPAPAASLDETQSGTDSVTRGQNLFSSDQTGCYLCHTPTLQTGLSPTASLSQKVVNLFSDLLVHKMGSTLADDVIQGSAGPDEFRTAPLWGLGQRIFFLHDGRTNDLMQAIHLHGGEASASVGAFDKLTRRRNRIF